MSSSVHEGIGGKGVSKTLITKEIIEQEGLKRESGAGASAGEAEPVSSSSKSGFSGAPTDNEITARGVSLVAKCKAEGAKVAGDHASLIELDAEIADHLGKMTCLETEFTAILNRKNELQRRL
ncbi:hypothetical protein Acr_00g0076290 [Actinidia rufa]|uniref:Uncharacterized protein n=1 Tax=Actinidia rufa TaxID=165716 RepID=A0A7J0DSW2_9ERIC|nr:hypothetical protein Acr_00g0076290 [Actinidia rufa]